MSNESGVVHKRTTRKGAKQKLAELRESLQTDGKAVKREDKRG